MIMLIGQAAASALRAVHVVDLDEDVLLLRIRFKSSMLDWDLNDPVVVDVYSSGLPAIWNAVTISVEWQVVDLAVAVVVDPVTDFGRPIPRGAGLQDAAHAVTGRALTDSSATGRRAEAVVHAPIAVVVDVVTDLGNSRMNRRNAVLAVGARGDPGWWSLVAVAILIGILHARGGAIQRSRAGECSIGVVVAVAIASSESIAVYVNIVRYSRTRTGGVSMKDTEVVVPASV
jgi:hypothetical protein